MTGTFSKQRALDFLCIASTVDFLDVSAKTRFLSFWHGSNSFEYHTVTQVFSGFWKFPQKPPVRGLHMDPKQLSVKS